MKPITDEKGNKLYGFSVNDMQVLIRWQKMQVVLIGAIFGLTLALLIWIARNDIITKMIYGG
jgi:hypothetical protein